MSEIESFQFPTLPGELAAIADEAERGAALKKLRLADAEHQTDF